MTYITSSKPLGGEKRWWLDSNTVRGILLTVCPTVVLILKMFNIELGPEEVEVIIGAIAGLCGAIGVVLGIVGRKEANIPLEFGLWRKG